MNWNGILPSHVAALRDVLTGAGYQAYPVGGCVRDLLLGRAPGDWDMTTSARPEEVLALFPQAIPTGLAHGTVTVPTEGGPVEITTFRREGGYSDGRHPDRVDFVPSLEEDLARRDFTINAMALSPGGEVIDPFGGRGDLEARVIRCVGDPAARFGEDRLRMFRALRFAAQLGFALHPSVAAALGASPSTAGLARERVRVEVDKALLSPRPQWVGEMVGYGLLAPWLGGAPAVDTAPLLSLPPQPLARWAGLLALLDRAGVDPHPLLDALVGERRLRLPLERGLGLWRAGLPQDGRGWRHALARLGEDACHAGVWMALALGDPVPRQGLTSTLGERPCLTVAGLALSGGELAQLGLSGPDIGAAQARLLDHVLDRPEDNRREVLLELLNP